MPSFSDAYQEWAGDIFTPKEHSGCEPADGGLILKNIRHQNYNFAKDVRILGFWIDFSKTVSPGVITSEKKFFAINTTNFTFSCIEQWKENDLNPPSPNKDASKQVFFDSLKKFDYFRYIFGIRAVYISKPNLFPANCEFEGLQIDHHYLFSKYSSSPSHEPTGNLQAARFFPAVTTKFKPNAMFNASSFPQYKINEVRFDHRLHLALDSLIGDNPVPSSSFPSTALNFGGVFKDLESPMILRAFTGGVKKVIFEAAEKPLIFEITAKGYENSHHLTTNNVQFWDNVHWWGEQYDILTNFMSDSTRTPGSTPKVKVLKHPSTPGAFFAAHFHWRWGKGARDEAPKDGQYVGSPSNEYLLIDPAIAPQSLSFAVVKNKPAFDPDTPGMKPENLSTLNFFSLFNPGAAAKPDDISGGANNVLFVSIVIQRGNNVTGDLFSGTQLLQGIFFAHNPEPGFFSKSGDKDPQYFPNDEKTIRKAQSFERY